MRAVATRTLEARSWCAREIDTVVSEASKDRGTAQTPSFAPLAGASIVLPFPSAVASSATAT